MKILDKIALVVFSVIILMISIAGSLIIFGWIDIAVLYIAISNLFKIKTACNIILGVNIVFILLALKAIFFQSNSKKDIYNDSILLENDDGRLIITKETLVGLINGVVSGFGSIYNYQTKIILDGDNNLSITLNLETDQDTVIKELINNLQIKVKEKLKDCLDLEVKSLDVRVKNVVESKEEKINE